MDEKPFETINVIPFVDIMLVLLAIVLTTANFMVTGRIPVAPPQAAPQSGERHNDRIITLTADGTIYLDDVLITKEVLGTKLAGLSTDTSFLIRADHNLVLQRFIDVAEIFKQRKFTKIALQTVSTSK